MALTLRAARINKGLSRQEAAKLLGVGFPPSAITNGAFPIPMYR